MAQQMEIGTEELTSPEALKASLAEGIATALFVFVGVGSIVAFKASGGNDIIGIATAHGLMIGLLAAGAGPISGGHINPAVTFAMVLTGNTSVVRGAMYVIAQLLGAVIGMLVLKEAVIDIKDIVPGAGGHLINKDVVHSTLYGFCIEAVLTFLLVWTVFATAVNPKGSGNFAPFFIGSAILAIHLIAVPLTGAGVNPARTFGPALVMNRWSDHWVYWIGPLVGGGIAGLLYHFLYLQDQEKA